MHPRIIAKRSLVWEHFKQTSLKVVTCEICKKDLTFFGNTTNMKEHLRRKHKIITAPVLATQPSSCDIDRIDERQRNHSSTDIPSTEQASCHIQLEVSPTLKSYQETIPLSVNSVAAATLSCEEGMTETSNHVIQDTDTEIATSYATSDYYHREETMYDRHKRYRLDHSSMLRSQTLCRNCLNPTITSDQRRQDGFTVFGEYVASEMRSIRGDEWTLAVLQKRILDAIYETKMKFLKKAYPKDTHRVSVEEDIFKKHNNSNNPTVTSSREDVASEPNPNFIKEESHAIEDEDEEPPEYQFVSCDIEYDELQNRGTIGKHRVEIYIAAEIYTDMIIKKEHQQEYIA